MSLDAVREIIVAAKTEIALLLPTYKQMSYEIDETGNSAKTQGKRFGFRVLGAVFNEEATTNRRNTVSHEFEMKLTEAYINQGNDEAQVEAVNILMLGSHTVAKNFQNKKLGLSFVKKIDSVSLDEPEFLVAESVAVVKMTFKVLYRYDLA